MPSSSSATEAHGAFSEPGNGPPHPKRQKIRESCNACGAQKLRCGKERPACARCVDRGLECRYDFSRRTGPRCTSYFQRSPTASPQPGNCSSDNAFFTLESDPDLFATFSGLGGAGTASHGNHGDPNIFDMDDPFQQNGELRDSTALDLGDLDPSMMLEGTNSSGGPASMSTHDSDDFDGLLEKLPIARPNIPTASRPASLPAPPTTQSRPDAQSQHHARGCITTALHIVAKLHVSKQTCAVAVPGAEASKTQPAACQDINVVLNRNREAMASLRKILECPCSNESEVLMSTMLAARKAILWYAAASCVDGTLQDQQATARVERVAKAPVFIGNYCLDFDAQVMVRAHLVLAELKAHVQPLLKLLRQRSLSPSRRDSCWQPSSPVARSSGSISAPASDVIDCLQRTLREDVSILVLKLREICKA